MNVSHDLSAHFESMAALAMCAFDSPDAATQTILRLTTASLPVRSSFLSHLSASDDLVRIIAVHHEPGGVHVEEAATISLTTSTMEPRERAFWQGMHSLNDVTPLTDPVDGYAIGAPVTVEDNTFFGMLGAIDHAPPVLKASHEHILHILAHRLGEEIRRQQQIDHRNHMKGDFVSIVSHEFRTALMGILGFSQMLRDEPCTPDEIHDFAADIYTDAKRINRMISDMLDLDRMESGRIKLIMDEVDLNTLLRDIVCRFSASTTSHIIRLQDDATLPPVIADADKIVQLLSNLVSNAIKYSPEDSEIVVGTTLEERHVHIWVRDQGIGIPADALERIFERYSRVETKTSRYIQGTGLGLPIVRQIAQMHGGHVWAESTMGEGSTFHVTLPISTYQTKSASLATI